MQNQELGQSLPTPTQGCSGGSPGPSNPAFHSNSPQWLPSVWSNQAASAPSARQPWEAFMCNTNTFGHIFHKLPVIRHQGLRLEKFLPKSWVRAKHFSYQQMHCGKKKPNWNKGITNTSMMIESGLDYMRPVDTKGQTSPTGRGRCPRHLPEVPTNMTGTQKEKRKVDNSCPKSGN